MTRAQASIVAETAEVFFVHLITTKAERKNFLPSDCNLPQGNKSGKRGRKGPVVFSKSYGSWPLGACKAYPTTYPNFAGGKKADQGGFEPPEHCCQGQIGFAKSNATSNGLLALYPYLTLLPPPESHCLFLELSRDCAGAKNDLKADSSPSLLTAGVAALIGNGLP